MIINESHKINKSGFPWVGLALGVVISTLLLPFVPGGDRVVVCAFAVPVIVLYMLLGDPNFTRRFDLLPLVTAAGLAVLATLLIAAGYDRAIGVPIIPWRWAVLAMAVVASVFLLAYGRDRENPLLADAAAILLVWMPVEFKLLPVLPLPPSGRAINLIKLLMVPFLVWSILFVRRWHFLGFDLHVRLRELKIALIAFLAFLAVGLPLALLVQFIRPSHSLPRPLEMIARLIVTWAFVALPEELLFRGMIQGGLSRALRSPAHRSRWIALAITSLIFGASHLDNPPNIWRYAMLATLAGVAYGWAYLKTGNVVTSSLVHMFVDWTWSVFFHG